MKILPFLFMKNIKALFTKEIQRTAVFFSLVLGLIFALRHCYTRHIVIGSKPFFSMYIMFIAGVYVMYSLLMLVLSVVQPKK